MQNQVSGRLVWSISALLLAGAAVASGQQYSIATRAGGAPPTTPATAINTSIGPTGKLTTDASNNVYFSAGNCVYKLTPGGTLNLVAGNSRAGYSGDGGLATSAQLNSPQGLALDKAGNLYISDSLNNRVRVGSATTGIITTLAGNGTGGYSGDNGVATSAELNSPYGVAVDASGNIYIADTFNLVIRTVTASTGIITTVAGNGTGG